MTKAPHPFAAFSRKYAPLFAAICTVILVLMWNNSGPTSVLVSGHQFVEGQVRIQAGPLRVDVNGRASIRVTPPAPFPSPQDVSELSRYSLPQELAEAIVSVSVHRGSVTVFDHGEQRVDLGPGESRTFAPKP